MHPVLGWGVIMSGTWWGPQMDHAWTMVWHTWTGVVPGSESTGWSTRHLHFVLHAPPTPHTYTHIYTYNTITHVCMHRPTKNGTECIISLHYFICFTYFFCIFTYSQTVFCYSWGRWYRRGSLLRLQMINSDNEHSHSKRCNNCSGTMFRPRRSVLYLTKTFVVETSYHCNYCTFCYVNAHYHCCWSFLRKCVEDI